MKFVILCFFLLIQIVVFAQKKPTQAEVKKALQMQADAIKGSDKEDADDKDDVNGEELLLKLPARKTALLSAIPPKTLSKEELAAYLQKLKAQLTQKIGASKLKVVKAAIIFLNNDPDKLHSEAISAWYNGAQQEAVLLLLQAALKKPNDGLLLNNLAAFLNMGGAANKAIPILKNLLLSYPENPMLLNNIGQSYASIGAADSAMYYLARCIKVAPLHAAANHTAGVIEATKGNTTKAESHFIKAATTSPDPETIAALKKVNSTAFVPYEPSPAYTAGLIEATGTNKTKAETLFKYASLTSRAPETIAALKKIDSHEPVMKFYKPKFKLPGDFNPFKYELPKQLEDESQTQIVLQEHRDYWEYLNYLITKYGALMEEEGEKGERKLKQTMAAMQKNPFAFSNGAQTFIRPFTKSANLAIINFSQDIGAQQIDAHNYKEKLEKEINEAKERYKLKSEALASDYKAKYDKLPYCGEARCFAEADALERENCMAKKEAINTALKEMAALRRDIQEKLRIAAVNKFELMAYWGYLAGANEGFAKQGYYSAIIEYLKDIRKAAVTQDLGYACRILPEVAATEKEKEELAKIDCPFKISLNFIAGKIELDCEKFSFSGGEGLTFNPNFAIELSCKT